MKKDSALTFPSLNALRAFTAVGTHLNLKRATKELFVTSSAVNHKIRELTDAGRMLLPCLARGFAQIETAVYAVPTENPLRLSPSARFPPLQCVGTSHTWLHFKRNMQKWKFRCRSLFLLLI